MSQASSLGAFARHYAHNLSLAIFPLVPGTKRPLTKNGFKDATTDVGRVDRWWAAQPMANIGCATGLRSGIVVLDIDAKPNADIILVDFEQRFAPVPATTRARSGGGGHHFYFSSAKPLVSRTSIVHGVDFKADGGYIVLPPSLHASGLTYQWVSIPQEQPPFSEVPEWLVSAVSPATPQFKDSSRAFRQIVDSEIFDGHRTDTLVSLIGYLLARKVESLLVRDLVLSINQTKFNPPLPVEKVLRTLNSIAAREIHKRGGVR